MATPLIEDLQAMPFGEMIGSPLSACVEAQEHAALTTVNFIRNVGFAKDQNGKTTDQVVNVTFMYKRENKQVELTVPLLTIVPIPFIAIDTVNINFKANLKSFQRETGKEKESESDYQRESGSNYNRSGIGWYSANYNRSYTSAYGSVSTKKDSVSTQTSQYSVEATIDINVVAHQESMPAGMARVLEMLNQAIFLEPTDKEAQIESLQNQINELRKEQEAEKKLEEKK